jgi:hypothetical protein
MKVRQGSSTEARRNAGIGGDAYHKPTEYAQSSTHHDPN